ncbi:MAG TPA: hypothetical protein VGR92_06040 [Steroidobacteraceae bacterium]|nr:hypothetical protein [Steroidobacteraceae bacterium]
MSTDNVTPIRDWHAEAYERIDSLDTAMSNLPADNLTPGYTMPMQTAVDLQRICRLLDEAQKLLDAAVERDDRPYNEYCEKLEAQGI